MEERKRPLGATDDVAPPSKRQQVNGSKVKDEDNKDETWVEVGHHPRIPQPAYPLAVVYDLRPYRARPLPCESKPTLFEA